MAHSPQYLVKRRTLEAARPNRYGHKVRHGKWVTHSRHDTLDAALAVVAKLQGLYDTGIFHNGKRLPNSH